MMKNAMKVDAADIKKFNKAFSQDKLRLAMKNAFSKLNIEDLAFNGDASRKMQFKFSVDIKTMSATNQKGSGRCWLFAATNVLREKVAAAIGLDSFELSQSYLAFWDKFERINYYLESIIDTAALPVSDRTVDCIVATGIGDGGQWDMFVNIVNKYGIVPKDAMPETFQSENTHHLNNMLNLYLRKYTPVLRGMVAQGATEKEIQAKKKELLGKCYSFMVSCYGEPPAKFDFEYIDKDKKYHKDFGYTPITFCDKYIGKMLDDYVSIIHAPTADKPFNSTYTVKYLGNIIGGKKVMYLNLELDTFKKLVISQLKDGELVWFGSDCGKFSERTKKQWDPDSYDFEAVTGLDTDMSKADMLDFNVSRMNHAMVICGVNLDDKDVPDRWKIENSWGSDGTNGGYHMASDKWFDDYVYQAVVNKKYLGELVSLLDKEPIELEPWDPMGSLAD